MWCALRTIRQAPSATLSHGMHVHCLEFQSLAGYSCKRLRDVRSQEIVVPHGKLVCMHGKLVCMLRCCADQLLVAACVFFKIPASDKGM
jgi:hypothetical protein